MKFHQRVSGSITREGNQWGCDIVYFSFFILPVFRGSLGSDSRDGLERMIDDTLSTYRFNGWRVTPDCSGRSGWEEFWLDVKLMGVALRREGISALKLRDLLKSQY
jgi:hypothetical protein